jgi:hypothetical protein
MTGASARRRRVVLVVAALGLAAVAAALAPRPAALTGPEIGERGFAALASAAIVAVAVLPLLVWRDEIAPAAWVVAAAAALALGISAFVAAGYAARECSARYGQTSVVIGTRMTEVGAAYRKANPELSNDDLLFDAAGRAERVWTPESIARCRAIVAGSHFLWIPFLIVCLLSTAQVFPATRLSPVRERGGSPTVTPEVVLRYDAFLSYRHEGADKAFAAELLEALESDGYRVAIDERDFHANASFLLEMERCVRESRFTLAVISRRYLDSDNTQEEAIISRVLDLSDRRRRLIPIVIERAPMPAWLYGIVGIDFTKSDPVVDPFDKLKATLGPPMTSASA